MDAAFHEEWIVDRDVIQLLQQQLRYLGRVSHRDIIRFPKLLFVVSHSVKD